MSKRSEKELDRALERANMLKYTVIGSDGLIVSRHEQFPEAASKALAAAEELNIVVFVSEVTYAVIPERSARVINAKL